MCGGRVCGAGIAPVGATAACPTAGDCAAAGAPPVGTAGTGANAGATGGAAGASAPWELYDLAQDRGESRDLAAEHPDKVKELAARWAELDAEYARQGATGK